MKNTPVYTDKFWVFGIPRDQGEESATNYTNDTN